MENERRGFWRGLRPARCHRNAAGRPDFLADPPVGADLPESVSDRPGTRAVIHRFRVANLGREGRINYPPRAPGLFGPAFSRPRSHPTDRDCAAAFHECAGRSNDHLAGCAPNGGRNRARHRRRQIRSRPPVPSARDDACARSNDRRGAAHRGGGFAAHDGNRPFGLAGGLPGRRPLGRFTLPAPARSRHRAFRDAALGAILHLRWHGARITGRCLPSQEQ